MKAQTLYVTGWVGMKQRGYCDLQRRGRRGKKGEECSEKDTTMRYGTMGGLGWLAETRDD